jgi:hypothetical protein
VFVRACARLGRRVAKIQRNLPLSLSSALGRRAPQFSRPPGEPGAALRPERLAQNPPRHSQHLEWEHLVLGDLERGPVPPRPLELLQIWGGEGPRTDSASPVLPIQGLLFCARFGRAACYGTWDSPGTPRAGPAFRSRVGRGRAGGAGEGAVTFPEWRGDVRRKGAGRARFKWHSLSSELAAVWAGAGYISR